MNGENNKPAVFLPPGPFVVKEDEELKLTNSRIEDADNEISANLQLAVRLSMEEGVISLNATHGLSFSVGDGLQDELMSFHGSTDSVINALGSITYCGHLNWWVHFNGRKGLCMM